MRPRLERISSASSNVANSNPRAAARIVTRIRYAAEQLGAFPRMGRSGLVPGTYEWTVRGLPYIIVYEIHSDLDVIAILGIFHGAQDRQEL